MNKVSSKELLRSLTAGIFEQNPVLVMAMGAAPVIIMGVTLKASLALAVFTAAVILPTCVFATSLGKIIPLELRPVLYVMIAAALLFPASLLSESMHPDMTSKLGILIPLTAVNSILMGKSEGQWIKSGVLVSIVDAFGTMIGFTLAICLVGAIREFLSKGTLWDIDLGLNIDFPAAAYAFFGLILMGFLAAGVRAIQIKRGDS